MPSSTTLVWLRRDLRLHDHAALATALGGAGAIQPVFIFDSEILERFTNRQDRRLSFLAATLCRMAATIAQRGGELLVLHGAASRTMPKLAEALDAGTIVCAEDFEPATIARDAAVKAAIAPRRFVTVLDHLIHHPARMCKDDGTPYKVFTPYYKGWRNALSPMEAASYAVEDRGRYAPAGSTAALAQKAGLTVVPTSSPAAMLAAVGYDYRADDAWTVDDVPARLDRFIDGYLKPYGTARDRMDKAATSRLGPYLRHGLVSVRECVAAALEAGGAEVWIKELGWREFYATILLHFPQVVGEAFNERYRAEPVKWRTNAAECEAFMQGKTGYPVVDAAVRELLNTGWMHNRARMIVASFFTKHLLMDWRIGEEFFAQHLMDYDLASNNGGWQWAASTGTDAQPYFRVFNPVLQSQKFDPHGDYIRHYVPELAGLSDKEIHTPWKVPARPKNYPAPIVGHEAGRARALEAFRR
jgi:deoxyribodipyrimidine photo-lyase